MTETFGFFKFLHIWHVCECFYFPPYFPPISIYRFCSSWHLLTPGLLVAAICWLNKNCPKVSAISYILGNVLGQAQIALNSH